MFRNVLIIGKVWPESKSSAAGFHMLQLIDILKGLCEKIVFASTSNKTEFTDDLGSDKIECTEILLNDNSFDKFISELQPEWVIFDRFMTEEQFGWRVREVCPQAIRLLNTEDLHSIRSIREKAVIKNLTEQDLLDEEIVLREMASVYQSDGTIIISDYEYKLLHKQFHVNKEQLLYLPFLFNSGQESKTDLPFENRSDIVFIGNFMHQPNKDAVIWFYNKVWPLLLQRANNIKCKIYGAYVDDEVKKLHQPSKNFFIEGRIENPVSILSKARLSVAPLRFGAGLKGKIFDSFLAGTPVITTNIGAEGMSSVDINWPGEIVNNELEFCGAILSLYNSEESWQKAKQSIIPLLKSRFDSGTQTKVFKEQLHHLKNNLSRIRKQNIIGAILKQEYYSSKKYLSKWIEEKQKK